MSVKLIDTIIVVWPILCGCDAFAFIAFELDNEKARIHFFCLRDKLAEPNAEVKGSALALINHEAHFHCTTVNFCPESTIVLVATILALILLSLVSVCLPLFIMLRFIEWYVRVPCPYNLPGHVIVDFIVVVGC
jgi:hypothetical protein